MHASQSATAELNACPAGTRAETHPFIKWAGGKSRLLPRLQALMPLGGERMRHIEPFVGGGALFFARTPPSALLSDKNPHLCTTYNAVRDNVEAVITVLRRLASGHCAEQYYAQRTRYNGASLAEVERAALFIYLNKTCYNGLHRVNRRGEFNVPMGRYANPAILDADILRAASENLRVASIRCAAFEEVLDVARPGDFIYLDPPYVPVSATASFVGYAADGFTLADQRRLRDVFDGLTRRGCAVMASNSAAAEVRALYSRHRVDLVSTTRSISCAAKSRGHVNEVIIRNY